MWHHPDHMRSGQSAAAKSKRTPKHLVPHLQRQATMKGPKAGYNPKTAAKPQMSPTPIRGQAGSMQQAASQIKASPMPFQNPQGPLAPVPSKKSKFYGRR